MPGFEPVVAYGRKVDGLPRNPGWAIVAAWGFKNDLNSDKGDQFPKPVSCHKRSNFFLISVIIFLAAGSLTLFLSDQKSKLGFKSDTKNSRSYLFLDNVLE